MALKAKYPIATGSTPRDITPDQQRAVNCIGRLLARALNNGHRRCIPCSGGKTEWLI